MLPARHDDDDEILRKCKGTCYCLVDIFGPPICSCMLVFCLVVSCLCLCLEKVHEANEEKMCKRYVRGVMVIVVGNEHGDTSSDPGRDLLHFTSH